MRMFLACHGILKTGGQFATIRLLETSEDLLAVVTFCAADGFTHFLRRRSELLSVSPRRYGCS